MIKVIKGGMKVLSNMTKEEKEFIKKDLTLDNPAYAQVKKFSRFKYTSVSPYITFYRTDGQDLVVPRGYKIPFDYEVVEDYTVERTIPYPKFKLELRETQKEAYEAWAKDTENGTIVLSTGKGKSILGCYLAYKTKQRTLVIVQKTDLINSWTNDFCTCFGVSRDRVGTIQGKNIKIGSQITVATIQTLSKLKPEVLRSLFNKFGMIIQDECHHSPAKSYEMLRYFQAKYFVALTATDMRTDGLDRVINFMFGEVAFRNIVTGDDPDIMPYKVIIRKSNIKYEPTPTYTYKGKTINAQEAHILKESGKHVTRNPLNINELRDVIKNDRSFNTQVANDIISEYKRGKSCVAFFHTKDHTRALQELLVSFGVPTGQIQLFYGDSKEDDKTLIDRAESKEVLITLATYSKLSEGSNIKSLERGFLVSSVNNEVGVIQSVGRLRRTKEGKKDVIIYDYHHEGIVGIRNHINTRLKVYKAQGATVEGFGIKTKKTGTFTRGFKRA